MFWSCTGFVQTAGKRERKNKASDCFVDPVFAAILLENPALLLPFGQEAVQIHLGTMGRNGVPPLLRSYVLVEE